MSRKEKKNVAVIHDYLLNSKMNDGVELHTEGAVDWFIDTVKKMKKEMGV